ncbi:S1 family peptidase [Streptomyces rhizosphaericus]|uniref:S1 family peptidase n=1 Tax=Streptomyces rhizosphaericus TaxID=114699 RepID=UPI000A38FF64|nr:S1 family peptidase [Streptomyces rhizosphaericus]
MSHKRVPKRKIVFAGAGVAAVAAAAIILPNANASEDDKAEAAQPKKVDAASAADIAAGLASQLGEAFGGAYYDKDKQQVIVNVVGDNSNVNVQVKSAGAVARKVDNSTKALQTAAKTLKTKATIPGTSWSVDPKTNELRVTADSTVTGAKWDTLESTVKSLGDGMATLKKSTGEFKPFVAGGDAIFGGGARCSLGFNVTTDSGAPAFLTAGHCGVAAEQWSDSQNGAAIGTVQDATFPGDGDFALVTYDDANTEAPSTVNTGDQTVDIVGAGEATVGQQVQRMGSTTGLNDGSVTGLDATVNYPEGTVSGLIQTDVCAEPGDSGGPLFSADGQAIGLTSGGSGDCTSGGETFFQPVTTALEAVGAKIGDGGAAGGGGAADDGGAADGGAADGSGAAGDGAGADGAGGAADNG